MRTIHMSVQGEFINKLALEQCHLSYDICYAVDLLMACLQTDELSEAERLMLALRVLNGEVELRGTYPNDDYGPVELDVRKEKYDLRGTLAAMKTKIETQEKEIKELNDKLTCCGERLSDARIRRANEAWRDEWGGTEPIFAAPEYAPEPERTSLLGELLEQMHQTDSDEDYGWLEPSGKFHAVPFGEHQCWADHKAKMLGYLNDALHCGLGGDFLLDRGWVLLDNPSMGMARPTISETKPLTKAQREFLFDYYSKRSRSDLADQYLEEE